MSKTGEDLAAARKLQLMPVVHAELMYLGSTLAVIFMRIPCLFHSQLESRPDGNRGER
jgi:hypothetical protein